MNVVTTFILAGGTGIRLYPLTAAKAKPAVSFGADGCLLDVTLLNALRSNLKEICILVQYEAESIRRRLHANWRDVGREAGVAISVRSPRACRGPYRGTADAVRQNLDLVVSSVGEDILVLSGDHVYDMDYRDLLAHHRRTRADLTIATTPVPIREAFRFGIVECEKTGYIYRFLEKPEEASGVSRDGTGAVLASMGVYVFSAAVLAKVLGDESTAQAWVDFGRHVVPHMISSHRVCAYRFDGEDGRVCYWRDVGTVESYYRAQMDLLAPGGSFAFRIPAEHADLPFGRTEWNPAKRCLASKTSQIEGEAHESVVSTCARIEKGARVECSVLLEGSVVEAGAFVRRAILDEGATVRSGAVVDGDCWIGTSSCPGYVYKSTEGVAVVTRPKELPQLARSR
jgi:glucose-1-phosphate adenylyltransferase